MPHRQPFGEVRHVGRVRAGERQGARFAGQEGEGVVVEVAADAVHVQTQPQGRPVAFQRDGEAFLTDGDRFIDLRFRQRAFFVFAEEMFVAHRHAVHAPVEHHEDLGWFRR